MTRKLLAAWLMLVAILCWNKSQALAQDTGTIVPQLPLLA